MENQQSEKDFKIENFLSIVKRLNDGLLITEEEKLKMEVLQPTEMKAAIFDLMSKKNLIVAVKIFWSIRSVKVEDESEKKFTGNEVQNPMEITTIVSRIFGRLKHVASKIFWSMRSVKTEDEPETKCTHIQLQNPMEINTVIRNLFGWLEVEDLKSCRVVCQKWNLEAEPFLRKEATITFGNLLDSTTKIRHPENFLETFRHFSVSTTNHPFTSFRFLDKVEWRVSDLKNFIDQQKKNIKDLQIYDIKIFNEDGDWQEEYDISDWFAEFSVPKLTISCYEDCNDRTEFSFLLNILASTTHIKLEGCKIKIGNQKPIAPIAIDFTDLKFFEEGDEGFLDEYCLNDSIDFSKTKDIRITCNVPEECTIPKLDISKCVSANYISLNEIQIVNWKESKALIKTLELHCISFLEKSEMEIKELHFSGSPIDLWALPLSIEKLHFGRFYEGDTISCSQPITLPNLKILKLDKNESELYEYLQFFANCSNLQTIEIDGMENRYPLLNVKWIPKSVTRMKLNGIENIRRCGRDEKLKLDVLHLEDYSLANAVKVLDKIIPYFLILQWKAEFESSASVLSFLQKFKHVLVYIGPFNWVDNEFETCPLAPHFDKKAEYYVCLLNHGLSISKKEFDSRYNK